MIATILILVCIILTAFWNGLVIRWKLSGEYSRLWHATGFMIRLLLCVVVYIGMGLWWFIGAVMLSWIPYNIIISLIVWGKWWHLSDKGIDGLIKKLWSWLT